MTALQTETRIGAQRPRLHACPPFFTSNLAQDTIDLAEHAGLVLDDWQRYVITETSGRMVQNHGKYAALEVGLIVPRQNGKGAIVEADQLKSLFLTKDAQSVYSAHQFKTARAMYRRIRDLVRNTPDLHELTGGKYDSRGFPIGGMYRNSNEETGIELKTGPRLNFFARSDGSARGFSAPKMWFDEAYDLSPTLIGDMIPTLSAMPSPQVWYISSAGKVSSEQLAKIRARGIRGDSARLAFYEWSAEEGSDLDDLDALYESNPALGVERANGTGLDLDYILEVERQSMDDEEYGRERYGLWQGRNTALIDAATWRSLANPQAFSEDAVAYGIDVSPDRSHASIGMAGWTPEGRLLVEFVEGRNSADWVVAVAEKINAAQRPRCFVIDRASPAATFAERLKKLRIPVLLTGATEYGNACGRFYDEAMGGLLVHLDQPTLNLALSKASKRQIGTEGLWAWNRKNSDADITPLVASTLAIHGLSVKARSTTKARIVVMR